LTVGGWAAGLSASTGSSAATRVSGPRTWSTTTHQIEPPRSPEKGYHLTEDLADKAIEFIADAKQVAPHKPFYLHFCPGATHAPHHVPKEWADRYKGQFDDGWDAYRERVFARQKELGVMPADAELSRHDPDVPAWDSLSPDARRFATRAMEVFAGFLSHTDHHIGRLMDFLEEIGELENTILMLVSHNGASAEGGPTGTTNELQFFNNAPEPLEDSVKAIDELGGPTTFNHGEHFASAPSCLNRWEQHNARAGAITAASSGPSSAWRLLGRRRTHAPSESRAPPMMAAGPDVASRRKRASRRRRGGREGLQMQTCAIDGRRIAAAGRLCEKRPSRRS
jgi:arylsulfatase A-like enzyme